LLQIYVSQVTIYGRDGVLENSEIANGDDRHNYTDVDCDADEAKAEKTTSGFHKRKVKFHARTYLDSMEKLPTGFPKLIDKQVARKQDFVLKDVIKSAGGKISKCKSSVSFTLSVRIFETRTNLECIIDSCLYASSYSKAATGQLNH
ncbi:hypothetical protein ABG067_007711, partial [Albugo candida]